MYMQHNLKYFLETPKYSNANEKTTPEDRRGCGSARWNNRIVVLSVASMLLPDILLTLILTSR